METTISAPSPGDMCARCGSAVTVEAESCGYGYIAVCRNCYDGPEDSIGCPHGWTKAEALEEWRTRNEEWADARRPTCEGRANCDGDDLAPVTVYDHRGPGSRVLQMCKACRTHMKRLAQMELI